MYLMLIKRLPWVHFPSSDLVCPEKQKQPSRPQASTPRHLGAFNLLQTSSNEISGSDSANPEFVFEAMLMMF